MFQEKSLVRQFNRGNRAVVRRIYEMYKDNLVTLATALLYEKDTAEDVVHDVFVGFIGSAKEFRLTGSLKGYLSTCVANNARNRNKAKQRRRSKALDEAGSIVSNYEGPDSLAIFGERLGKLGASLAVLPYEQREVVLLHLYSGMRFRAIAEAQGVSINTVQGRYRYGLGKLRSMLNGEVSK